jgi:hypothetical protein
MVLPSLILLIKWLRSRVFWANTGFVCFFLWIYFLFQSHYSILIFFKKKIGFIVFFLIFLFIRLSWSHNLACGFSKLTQLSSHLSFSFFFLWDSFMLLIFFISFFNIWFVENWPTWFFYIWCFQSNGSSHKFYKLTRFSIKFFLLLFFHLIIWHWFL